MFEAQLTQGSTFKDIIEAIKDLVQDCNLDVSDEEMAIQSMDSAHVSLVAVHLSSQGFEQYRCDRPNSLGINTKNMSSILKMLGDKDNITFKAEDDKPDALIMMFESEQSSTIADFGTYLCCCRSHSPSRRLCCSASGLTLFFGVLLLLLLHRVEADGY